MATQRLGIIMHGVTGRMGMNQHLIRSICAIRAQGGVTLSNGDKVMPDPILVGRNAEKMEALAQKHGIARWGTDLDAALANPDDTVFFDAGTTQMRPTLLAKAIRAGKHVYCEKPIATNLNEAVEIARVRDQGQVRALPDRQEAEGQREDVIERQRSDAVDPGRIAGARQRGPSRKAVRSAARALAGSPSPAHRARRMASRASRWRGSSRRVTTSSRSAAGGSAMRCSSTAISSRPAASSARRNSASAGRADIAPALMRAPCVRAGARPPRRRDHHQPASVSSQSPASPSASIDQIPPPAEGMDGSAMASPGTATGVAGAAAGAGTAPATPADTSSSRSGKLATRAWLAPVSHQSRCGPATRKGPGCRGTTE